MCRRSSDQPGHSIWCATSSQDGAGDCAPLRGDGPVGECLLSAPHRAHAGQDRRRSGAALVLRSPATPGRQGDIVPAHASHRETASVLSPRWELALVVTATIVATALRLPHLGKWSLWTDEMMSIQGADYINSSNALQLLPAMSFGFSLFFYILKPVFAVLGISAWSARLVPALIGIISVPTLHAVARRALGPVVATVTTILLAVAPWHLAWSQNARFYTMLLLLYNVALFTIYRGLETDQPRLMALAIPIWAMALCHTPDSDPASSRSCSPTPPRSSCCPLVDRLDCADGRFGFSRCRCSCTLPTNSIALPAAGILWHRWSGFAPSIHADAPDYRPLRTSVRSLAGIVYYLGVPVCCQALFGAVHLLRDRRRAGLFLLLSATVPLLVVLFPMGAKRFAFLCLPSWLALAAAGIEGLLGNSHQTGAIADRRGTAHGRRGRLVPRRALPHHPEGKQMGLERRFCHRRGTHSRGRRNSLQAHRN